MCVYPFSFVIGKQRTGGLRGALLSLPPSLSLSTYRNVCLCVCASVCAVYAFCLRLALNTTPPLRIPLSLSLSLSLPRHRRRGRASLSFDTKRRRERERERESPFAAAPLCFLNGPGARACVRYLSGCTRRRGASRARAKTTGRFRKDTGGQRPRGVSLA